MRLPRTYYFSGGYIRFEKKEGVVRFFIYNQLPTESKPMLLKGGIYDGQNLVELSRPFVLKEPYKTIMENES